MEDIHKIFSQFKEEFPEIHAKQEALGKEVHEKGAMAAGVDEAEIKHALLLLIPTAGFPAFMKSYAVFKGIK
jgi:alkylhydroperoxidase/carboxymuconolactone decarboxylase family protein YurZ